MNGLSPDVLASREKHISSYMGALLSYRAGDFAAAKTQFSEHMQNVNGDSVAEMYLTLIESMNQRHGMESGKRNIDQRRRRLTTGLVRIEHLRSKPVRAIVPGITV